MFSLYLYVVRYLSSVTMAVDSRSEFNRRWRAYCTLFVSEGICVFFIFFFLMPSPLRKLAIIIAILIYVVAALNKSTELEYYLGLKLFDQKMCLLLKLLLRCIFPCIMVCSNTTFLLSSHAQGIVIFQF